MVSRIGRRKFLATLGGAYLAGRGARAAAGNAGDWTQYSGFWTFRVFEPMYAIGRQPPPEEDALIRAEADINFEPPPRLQWRNRSGGISGLDLNVTVKPSVGVEPEIIYSVGNPNPPGWQPLSFYAVGTGRPNTDTAGWEYDYHGLSASPPEGPPAARNARQ
jgi:hypothetical protein